MGSGLNTATLRLKVICLFAFISSWLGHTTFAQQPARGTISGQVAADQGQVIGFRVAAHNLDRRLWYTVFTNKGHYTVPQALPGKYEVTVFEPDYESPNETVQLGPGGSQTADLQIKKRAPVLVGGNIREPASSSGKIEYVNRIEDMFPPGPGLDNLKKNCTGCHFESFNGFGAMHYTKERFLESIEMMTETGPGYNPFVLALGRTPMSRQQKNVLADYLVKNFGPGTVEKRSASILLWWTKRLRRNPSTSPTTFPPICR